MGLVIDLSDAEAMEEFAADLAVSLERDPIIAKALEQGLSLRDYSKEVDKELAEAEALSLEEYAAEAPDVAELHKQLEQCDAGLETLQATLTM